MSSTSDIVGYRIKEDWFYNYSWQLSETRIIAICPIIKRKDTGDLMDAFWIYYPELRNIFASEKIEIAGEKNISSLEDIFMFRRFNSTIYKESNIYNKKIADYVTDKSVKELVERIEIELLDLEHDAWINTTNKQ
jgi:hypothetical protein